MSIRLVVFDWNGTLFDDTRAVIEAANRSEIPMLGLPPLTVTKMREVYEVPLVHAYEKLGIPASVFKERSSEIGPVFHKVYEPLAARARTRPGTRWALDRLKGSGKRMIILSNHTMEGIYFQLTRLRLGPYFEDVLANETQGSAHHTGKQHRLEQYLAKQSIDQAEIAIVGDTPEEIRIGRSLGIRTVAIHGGMCSRERLVATKPDVLVSSVKQIVTALEEFA